MAKTYTREQAVRLMKLGWEFLDFEGDMWRAEGDNFVYQDKGRGRWYSISPPSSTRWTVHLIPQTACECRDDKGRWHRFVVPAKGSSVYDLLCRLQPHLEIHSSTPLAPRLGGSK